MENDQENNRVLPRPYALALLTLWRDANGPGENPPLGWALRYETSTSTFNLPAHRLLQALIEHPPSPAADQVVARRFMTELLLCGNPAVINLGDAPSTLCDTFYVECYVQVNNLNSDYLHSSPDEWAIAVFQEIEQNGGNMVPLENLAGAYLNDLVIPSRVQCNICWM
jgi:hypothetical protein